MDTTIAPPAEICLLLGGAYPHVSQKSVHRDEHVYQQHPGLTNSSCPSLSPGQAQSLSAHPSTHSATFHDQGGVTSDDGSIEAENARGLGNIAQAPPTQQARFPVSAVQGNPVFDSEDSPENVSSPFRRQEFGCETPVSHSGYSSNEPLVDTFTRPCDQRLPTSESTYPRTCTSVNLLPFELPNGNLLPSPPDGEEGLSSTKPKASESEPEPEPELDSRLLHRGRGARGTPESLVLLENDSPRQGHDKAHEVFGALTGEELGSRYPGRDRTPVPHGTLVATNPASLDTSHLSSLGPGTHAVEFLSGVGSFAQDSQDANDSEGSITEDDVASNGSVDPSPTGSVSIQLDSLGFAGNAHYGGESDDDCASSGPGGKRRVRDKPVTRRHVEQDSGSEEIAAPSEETGLIALLQQCGIGDSDFEKADSDSEACPSPIGFLSRRHVCCSSSENGDDDENKYNDDLSDAEVYSEDSDDDDEVEEEEVEYLSGLGESDSSEDEEAAFASDLTTNSTVSPSSNIHGRRRFTSEERELIRMTREVGACVRCRFQKIKCHPDHNNPTGKCKTCKRFSKTSPKTIHRIPCLRLRITDIVLYRSGGLNLTRRWKSIEMRDVGDRIQMEPLIIAISQNLCEKPLLIEVVRFTPREGDVTARYWTDYLTGKETFKKKELANYCLKSIHDTAQQLRKYTIDNALSAFFRGIQEDCESEPEGGPIMKTYLTAMTRYMTLHKEQAGGNKLSQDEEKEVEILGNLFILWCAIQHTVGSLHIEGSETLGMLPETTDETYPLYGKVSVPRMIVAQFDNLNYNGVLERYKEKLLKDIDWLFSQDKSRWWFTIYLIIFILLRETSRMTADRYRHARANHGSKYATVDKPTTPRDAGFNGYTGNQDTFDWDHPLYWVAQMFEKDWYPHPTYQREPLPKMTPTAAIASAC
ncbi:hypothetical protein FHETE_7619 [Fusarium heterosporum]|uniref:Zn(2)-C6 fungal-type domain-containing protein n=1 Tax=Fusarium heterosporum TaxID=42747 RepID=A0A8H5T656_FUSHE|nr:hypothetical protein FHETE_7619 [Fusarium heterosporum]